jgi:hypothetical protein
LFRVWEYNNLRAHLQKSEHLNNLYIHAANLELTCISQRSSISSFSFEPIAFKLVAVNGPDIDKAKSFELQSGNSFRLKLTLLYPKKINYLPSDPEKRDFAAGSPPTDPIYLIG